MESQRKSENRELFTRVSSENQKTANYLLEFPAGGPAEEVSEDAVSGSAGESRARSVTGTHANTGRLHTRFTRISQQIAGALISVNFKA